MCGRYASTRSAADLAALFDSLDFDDLDDDGADGSRDDDGADGSRDDDGARRSRDDDGARRSRDDDGARRSRDDDGARRSRDVQDETDGRLAADYNLAPTDPAPIVRLSARTTAPVLSVARWGLVPAWSRDTSGAARMINARSETIESSRAFGRSFAQRRCLVPADGWYEWRRTDAGKQPYFMNRGNEPLMFGGVWSAWSPEGGVPMLTFTIVTLPAEGKLTLVHDRMPLVLPPRLWRTWLTGPDPASLLVAPPPAFLAGIQLRPVSTAVSDVRNDGPELVREVVESSIVEPPLTLF